MTLFMKIILKFVIGLFFLLLTEFSCFLKVGYFHCLVSGAATNVDDPRLYFPIPDMKTFTRSGRKIQYHSHEEYLQRQLVAFKRLHYVEPDKEESWVRSSLFLCLSFSSFLL
jgi:hypothetical protein